MKLRFTAKAVGQIDLALDFIGERSPQGAAGLRRRISSAVVLLQEHPRAGQTTSRQGVRRLSLSPFPYVIFYRIYEEEVVILRFRHGARSPLSRSAQS
ncbi:MAG TPA: type II toxin-antitoxin system RelE/ParE family toxin [Xanthobacteraceae bacterium]|nr:type II toxin-antitoxin system RelE/ParE family toxin [Xanthobacteraceae bacterium]